MSLQCPACQVDLVMTERQGVEIDYCPKCRGVWLDRGELDKIVERGATGDRSNQPARASQPMPDRRREYDDDDDDRFGGGDNRGGRRRGGWLSDIFD